MIDKQSLNVTKAQIDADRELILKQAKEYSEQQMKLKKSKKKFTVYILVSAIFILILFIVYVGAIFYRHAQFMQMGL